jgi:hypothetical protein
MVNNRKNQTNQKISSAENIYQEKPKLFFGNLHHFGIFPLTKTEGISGIIGQHFDVCKNFSQIIGGFVKVDFTFRIYEIYKGKYWFHYNKF